MVKLGLWYKNANKSGNRSLTASESGNRSLQHSGYRQHTNSLEKSGYRMRFQKRTTTTVLFFF